MYKLISAIFVSTVLALSAQEQTISIRAMCLGKGNFPEVFFRSKDGLQALRFPNVQPSMPFRAVAQDPLPIFFKMPAEGDEMKPDALVPVENAKGGILLLGWQTGDEKQFVAIPDQLDKAKPDEWLLVNATAERIGVQLGKDTKPTFVEPGKSVSHRVDAPLGEGAAVTAAKVKDDKLKVIFSTYWTIFDDDRCIILFVQDGKRVRVRQIKDVTSRLAPEE